MSSFISLSEREAAVLFAFVGAVYAYLASERASQAHRQAKQANHSARLTYSELKAQASDSDHTADSNDTADNAEKNVNCPLGCGYVGSPQSVESHISAKTDDVHEGEIGAQYTDQLRREGESA